MNDLASLLPDDGFARFACDCLWQSALTGLLAVCVLWTVKLRPATRAWIALLAMSVCIVAPCATWLARAGGLGCLPSAVRRPIAAPSGRWLSAHDDSPAPVAGATDAALRERHFDSPVDWDIAAATDQHSDVLSPAPLPYRPHEVSSAGLANLWREGSWSVLACAWGAGSLLLAARLLLDVLAVLRLRRDIRLCNAEPILAACRQAARSLGLASAPPVAYSPLVSCPTVLAWGKPCILIPLGVDAPPALGPHYQPGDVASNQAELERWRAVFFHELGHVRRGDGWSGLIAEAITVLIPWQPLVWLLRREFRRGCEEACDDWALFGGVDPLDYAAALADWIPRRSQPLALGIRSRRLPIRRRIERLLVTQANLSPQLSSRWIVGGAGAAFAVATALALLQSGLPRKLAADEVLADAAAQPEENSAPDEAAKKPTELESHDATSLDRPSTLVSVLGESRLKHWNYAQSLGFSADGASAFSAGRDGVVQIWNSDTGQPRAAFVRPHVAAAASGDGRRIFLASEEGEIEIFDSLTGQIIQRLRLELPQARSYAVSLLAASHDGTIAAAGGRYSTATEPSEHFLAVWDGRTEQTLMTIVGRPPEWTPGVRIASWQCLSLSADGRRLAAGGLSHIGCWDTASGKEIHQLQGEGRIYALAFSPHGQTLASGDARGNVKLWKVADGAAVLRLEHRATISAISFSPGGEHLATVAGDSIALWDARAGTRLWSYQPADPRHRIRPINGDLKFSSDGRKLSVGFDNRLTLLDAQSGTELPLAGGALGSDFTALSVTASGSELLTSNAAGRLALWNLADGRLERSWDGHSHRIHALAVSPDGTTAASKAIDGSLILWDAYTAKRRHSWRHPLLAGGSADNDSLAFSLDGQTLASITSQRTLALWDVESGRLRDEIAWPESGELPLAFPSAGRFLLAAWQTGSRNVLGQIGESGRKYHGFQLALSPDGRYAAGGVYGNRLELWDVRAQRKTEIAAAHGGGLQSVVFSPDSGWLVTAAEDGRICFWNPQTGKRQAALAVGPPGGVIREVAVSSDGRYLASLNGNGTVSLHRSPVNWRLWAAERR